MEICANFIMCTHKSIQIRLSAWVNAKYALNAHSNTYTEFVIWPHSAETRPPSAISEHAMCYLLLVYIIPYFAYAHIVRANRINGENEKERATKVYKNANRSIFTIVRHSVKLSVQSQKWHTWHLIECNVYLKNDCQRLVREVLAQYRWQRLQTKS